MDYAEFAPPPALGRFVQCVWTLRGASREAAPQRVLPDGSVELVLHVGDEFRRHEEDGGVTVQPRALVVGVVDRWLMVESGRDVDVIGVRFRPGAVRGVLGIPQAELRGACHALGDLGVVPLRGLLEAVGNAPDDAGRMAALSAGLLQAAERATTPPQPVLHAARRIIGSSGMAPIGGLAADAGISLRHLERRFRREVGVTPKGLARLRRFQAVIGRLAAAAPPRWATLAAACGYADQAHLIREFREFAGTTPAAYWREAHPLSDLFHGSVDFLQDSTVPSA